MKDVVDAIKKNNSEGLKQLLENSKNEININETFKNGNTLLGMALLEESKDATLLLIEKGANANAAFKNGKHTPLQWVLERIVEKRHKEIEFEKNGASGFEVTMNLIFFPITILKIMKDNKLEQESLHYNEIAKSLIAKGADININIAFNKDNLTPLNLAYLIKDWEMIWLLIEHKADVNSEFKNSSTILLESLEHNKCEVVKALLENGAKVNKTYNDVSALAIAIAKGNIEMIKILIEHGADVNTASKGCTPLGLAIYRSGDKNNSKNDKENKDNIDYKEIAKLLIEKGAGVNDNFKIANDKNEYRPLGLAVKINNYEMAKLLINNRANIDITFGNTTALGLAIENGNEEIFKLLIDNRADVNKISGDYSPIGLAVNSGNEKFLETLIKHKADIDMTFERNTVLGLAIIKENYNIVEILLKNRVDVNKTFYYKNEEYTPLQMAMKNSNEKITVLLSKYNAKAKD